MDLNVAFPEDLRLWFGEDRLIRLVIEAVTALPAGRQAGFRHGETSYPFGEMLATLTYAYLSGRAGSEELEEEVLLDPALRYLCAGRTPPSTAFRHFRRVHRGALATALLQTLRLALAGRRALGWLGPVVPQMDPETPPGLELCARAAEARLDRAVFADTVALDV